MPIFQIVNNVVFYKDIETSFSL